MNTKNVLIISFALIASVHCAPPNAQPMQDTQKSDNVPPQLQPVYQQQQQQQLQPQGTTNQQAVDNYVPHASYPYADTYPNSGYDGYLVPAGNLNYPQAGEYMTSLMPTAHTALQVALKIFAKIGLFLVGGVALLVVGGIFTSAVCSLTPLCTITFAGMQSLDKDTMRSYVTPDKLSQAANFVQDAIGKYQRLQRAIN